MTSPRTANVSVIHIQAFEVIPQKPLVVMSVVKVELIVIVAPAAVVIVVIILAEIMVVKVF